MILLIGIFALRDLRCIQIIFESAVQFTCVSKSFYRAPSKFTFYFSLFAFHSHFPLTLTHPLSLSLRVEVEVEHFWVSRHEAESTRKSLHLCLFKKLKSNKTYLDAQKSIRHIGFLDMRSRALEELQFAHSWI